jgi:hypothetical protein
VVVEEEENEDIRGESLSMEMEPYDDDLSGESKSERSRFGNHGRNAGMMY